MSQLPFVLQFLVLVVSGWLNRRHQLAIEYLLEENRVLRQQLGDRRLRLTDDQRRRLAVRGKLLGRKVLDELAGLVTPETILRWYLTLVARKYDGSRKRGRGRPRTRADLADLVVRMAEENPTWGYTRIRGELLPLGHEIARSTIQRILADHGIEPAPERGRKMRWETFLKAHWEAIAAADFFTVEVPSSRGLVRHSVFFVLKLKTREVYIAGISPTPTGEWMKQIARNLTDAEDGFLGGIKHLILDRDPLYTTAFRTMLGDCGVKCLRLPARSPNLNAFAERFVLSIKSECLDRVIPLSEAHLWRCVLQYVAHYHHERAHQGLGNRRIAPDPREPDSAAPVLRRERLGGLLNHYHRAAA